VRTHRYALSAVAVLGLIGGLCSTAAAQTAQDRVVNANPANSTPHLAEDRSGQVPRVLSLATRHGVVYAGGIFHKVASPKLRFTKHRHNVAAFKADNGAFTDFDPKVNGPVWAVRTTRNAVYIGGDFTRVNGVPRKGLAKLNPRTGALDRSFRSPFDKGRVTDLALVDGRLIAGGTFARKLIALKPDTGAVTNYLRLKIRGALTGSSSPAGVFRFSVDPAGSRLVAVGNFTRVDGKRRARAFMVKLAAKSGALNRWWYSPLRRKCRTDAASKRAYLTDVDFAPNGNYFVVVSTGYVVPTSDDIGTMVCDAAARFETDVMRPSEPTWINYTGGDTLHSVAITGAAVYVQGHSRWLDNPYGVDSAGLGAVERLGGGAINPRTGKALAWNPVMPNQVGGYAFLATHDGLWIGRDGKRIGGEYHRGIAFMPLR
jgi:Domain of unknown function (DUF5122) beta-propeller